MGVHLTPPPPLGRLRVKVVLKVNLSEFFLQDDGAHKIYPANDDHMKFDHHKCGMYMIRLLRTHLEHKDASKV